MELSSGGDALWTIGDTSAPTVPQNLTATLTGSKHVDLAWQLSTDDVGVTSYQVYRGSEEIASLAAGAT